MSRMVSGRDWKRDEEADWAVKELSADTFAGLRIGELCSGAMVISKYGKGDLKTKI